MEEEPTRPIRRFLLATILLHGTSAVALQAETLHFGVAQANIDPDLPIRLSGYAARTTESNHIEQDIFATAAAFGQGADTAVLIAVDATGVPDVVVDAVAAALSQSMGIPQERINIMSSHSHNGPHVDGYLENLFGGPLPAAHQQHVEAYTQNLTIQLEQVALDALNNRTPGHTLSWGTGSVGFGVNRRGAGIVDHDLPVMRIADSLGNTQAIITSYAAHAVTLNSNSVSGDWPGYAREAIETLYPGAKALILTGAAGDINPTPRGSATIAQDQGQQIADEVARLVSNNLLVPVQPNIGAAHGEIMLPFATALQPGDPGSARLAPAGTPDHQYGITTWTFGNELAMVFLEGEVTVDYSLRLKSEYNDGRMWVNAYSNDVQGYVASERVLFEGGYEADDSGFYYALPGRFAHGLEDKIVDEVMRQLDPFFNTDDILRLAVNRATGGASIVNEGSEPITFDGYTIYSESGSLTGPWNSLADQGIEGWEEADSISPQRLTEFNPTGSTVLSGGVALSLGNVVSVPAPTSFGEEISSLAIDLRFEYTSDDAGVVRGIVELDEALDRHNNLVLTIDPASGQATLHNDSPYFDAAITAYTITSDLGVLQSVDGQWRSLQDQGALGWEEADNSDASRLTEFNPLGELLLEKNGAAYHLGIPVEIEGESIDATDFTLEFLLSTGEVLQGVVLLGPVPSALPGDYDGNGLVNENDYIRWRSTFGQMVAPGSGADGSGDGVIDAADYTVWRDHLGSQFAAATTAHTVPEPAACWLALGLALNCLLGKRQRSRLYLNHE